MVPIALHTHISYHHFLSLNWIPNPKSINSEELIKTWSDQWMGTTTIPGLISGMMGQTLWWLVPITKTATTTPPNTSKSSVRVLVRPKQWPPPASRNWRMVPPLASTGSRPSIPKPHRNIDCKLHATFSFLFFFIRVYVFSLAFEFLYSW